MWLTGALPAQPTQALVDRGIKLSRFNPADSLLNEVGQRRAMAQQLTSELVNLIGNGSALPVALYVLEGLGAELITRAATRTERGEVGNLYARALSAWASRELGDDPHTWAILVRLTGALTVTDIDLASLAGVVKTALTLPHYAPES